GGGPVGRFDEDPPGELGGTAQELPVEEVAPPAHRLGQGEDGEELVGPAQEAPAAPLPPGEGQEPPNQGPGEGQAPPPDGGRPAAWTAYPQGCWGGRPRSSRLKRLPHRPTAWARGRTVRSSSARRRKRPLRRSRQARARSPPTRAPWRARPPSQMATIRPASPRKRGKF